MGTNLPRPKPVNYELIDADKYPEPHDLLREAMHHHSDLDEAEVGLAWRRNWPPNKDGQVSLGRCVKASDLQREFMAFDFVVVLNFSMWNQAGFTAAMKLAVIDHELCHAAVAVDEDGDTKYNELGRPVYRVRKHDIEEFREVVERHGCFKADLQEFAKAIERGPSLFTEEEEARKTA